MGTTADKLALLMANKEAIRDAITEKTGEEAGEVMSTYAEKIRSIGGGQTFYTTTIRIDKTISDPVTMITKVYDDGAVAMIRANSHRYVCNMVDGVMQAKQLQDNNGTLYLDGTTADLTGAEGDVFMKLPEFWYKGFLDETNSWCVSFVYGDPQRLDYKYWDGKDFIGVYEAYVNKDNMYSRSGVKSTGSQLPADLTTYARNRGEGYTLVKWKHHSIMVFLFYAEYLNTNSQSICGKGTSSYSKLNGATDLLGMEDTSAAVNGNKQSINYFGLENWWGNKYEFVENVTQSSDYMFVINEGVEGRRFIRAYNESSCIRSLYIGKELDAVPEAGYGASDDTYFCDNYIRALSFTYSILSRSGSRSDTSGGIAYVSFEDSRTADPEATSRLVYRGDYEIIK